MATEVSTFPGRATSVTATIANGASLSDALHVAGAAPLLVVIPAAWTTANLTFQASYGDGTAYADLYDEFGTEVVATVGGAARVIRLNPAEWAGIEWLKIRSGTTATPVNQGAARSIVVVCRPV